MKRYIALFFLILLLLMTSCSSGTFSKDYWVMDTYCTVTLYGNTSSETSNLVSDTLKKCEESLLLKDNSKSFFADTDNCEVPIENDIYEMLEICLKISELSDGRFDITVAPLTELWDIQNRTAPPAESEINKAKDLVGYENIELADKILIIKKQGSGIDVGAVGKGFAGDKAAEELKMNGFDSGILNLGGNVTVFGENPNKEDGFFVIGIKDPINNSSVYASVKVKDTNVVTAGGYERYFEFDGNRYHHIIDPESGYPAENGIKSATVICRNGIIADALATTLYVCGVENGLEILKELSNDYPDIAALIYTDNGDLVTYNIENYGLTTYNFEGEIFYND